MNTLRPKYGPVFLLFSLRCTGVPQISCNTTWWTDGGSNPDFRLAKPMCSHYHYQPKYYSKVISCLFVKNVASTDERVAVISDGSWSHPHRRVVIASYNDTLITLYYNTIRKHIGKSLPETIAFALLTPVISYSLDLRFNSGMQTPFGLTNIHPQRYWAMCLLMVSGRGNAPLSLAYQATALLLS